MGNEATECITYGEMVFSKKKFAGKTSVHDKRLYSKYLDDMDGRKVIFESEFGFIELSDGDTIYPVYREWCEVQTEEQMGLF